VRSCKNLMTRRQFIEGTTAALAGAAILPGHVTGSSTQPSGSRPASEKLNIAVVGVGGMGAWNLGGVAEENIVALCDVDLRSAKASFDKYPDVKKYRDFRKMFDELEKSIDAVVIATPDHVHSVIAMDAMRRGIHVYCEKPLANSIWEVRELMKAAREHKVVTQLGNQGHSSETIRTFCEAIWDGVIGKVYTVYAAVDFYRPAFCKAGELSKLNEQHPVPPELDWDLWQGPVQERPYNPVYLPGVWRGWKAFGTTVLGDWACHVIDPVFWALDLGAPSVIVAENVGDYDPQAHAEIWPCDMVIRYEFPAKGQRGPVTLYWYGNGAKPPHPPGLDPDEKLPGVCAYLLGDKGGILHGSHGAGDWRIFPETLRTEYKQPPKKLPRVSEPGAYLEGHHQDWLNAIRSGGKAGSDFSYGGPLTEIALLGVMALRFPCQELHWDTRNARFTNNDEATRLLKPTFRHGWTL
jgi:predicted dehydrogenase